MKFNKEFTKRLSTYANALTVAVSGVMIYIPDLPINEDVKAWVMLGCGVSVTLCQLVSLGGKKDAESD